MRLFLIFFLLPNFSSAKDCWKKVYVQEIISYENPTPFYKDAFSEKIEKGEKKWVEITCEVFDSVSVGDYLKDASKNVSGFNFFNKKKRFIERRKYLILKKK